MKLPVKKAKAFNDLEKCITVISGLLQCAAEGENTTMFKEFFPVYCQLKKDFKSLLHINFIDCGIEFYAKRIGLVCEHTKLNNKSLDELVALSNRKMTLDETNELADNPNVLTYLNLGYTGRYSDCEWLVYTLVNGRQINIYYK